MPELHPYLNYQNNETQFVGGFIPANTRNVIIGTFPPENEYVNKGEGFFYYASERNHLWNTIDNVRNTILKKTANRNANESFIQNRDRKMQFCRDSSIGFLDIFTSVNRTFIGATKDIDLLPVENIVENGTFQNLISSHEIERICCVYTLAYDVLIQELLNIGAIVNNRPSMQTANGVIHDVTVFGKSFELLLLYPATRSRYTTAQKNAQYDHFLFQ